MKKESNGKGQESLASANGSGDSRCETCGHKWKTGTDGSHSCTHKLRDRVEKLEKASHEHERRIIWAMKFMKCPGAGQVAMRTDDGGFGELIYWEIWFADGLEILGRYKVDRELLGLSKKEREKILKAREANHQNADIRRGG